MAQIIVSGDELVCVLHANGLIPQEVTDIETAGEEIRVRVRTPLPLLTSIRVRLRFAGFERGHAVLQFVTNRFMDRLEWLLDKMLARYPLADHGARWEYPRLYVDVNQLLHRQVRGVQIAGVVFEDGRFHITTVHLADSRPPERARPAESGHDPPPADSRPTR
jgi:hypothetical protein